MVVGVIKSKDDSLRLHMENRFVNAISELNYYAVPAMSEFGPGGLIEGEQGDTYLKLCYNGIDAVMTIALIDGTKEKYAKVGNMYDHPAYYYYNRIWNYKNIQANLDNDAVRENKQYFWEIILYDLNTLEATCTIQARSFLEVTDSRVMDDFAKKIIQQMVRKKILSKKKNNSNNRKAF